MCVSQGAPGFTGQVGAQGANGSRVRLPLQVFIIIQLYGSLRWFAQGLQLGISLLVQLIDYLLHC